MAEMEFRSSNRLWEEIRGLLDGKPLNGFLRNELIQALDQEREYFYTRKDGSDVFVLPLPMDRSKDLIVSKRTDPDNQNNYIWVIEKITPRYMNKLRELDPFARAMLQKTGPVAIQK